MDSQGAETIVNVPEAGHIHWADFGPTFGTEQSGRRPAVVVSGHGFNVHSPRIIVCPVTSRTLDWPVVVPIPTSLRTQGVILCDQIRAIDRRARLFQFIEILPMEQLIEVRRVLSAILEIPALSSGT